MNADIFEAHDNPLIFIDISPAILYQSNPTHIPRETPMNKSQLIDTLRKENNLTKSKSEQVVELLFDEMSKALVAGDRVEVRGFCSIYVKEYEGYTGRNPKTGEPTEVPAKKLPYFKCGKELKERVDHK